MSKSIEELEGEVWGEPEFGSYVVTNTHRLRKKPTDQFTVEELRFMIGQNVGVAYLMPRTLGVLEANPLAEGDYHPGDLLASVVRVPDEYWRAHPDHLRRAISVVENAAGILQQRGAARERRHEAQAAWMAGVKSGKPTPEKQANAGLLRGVRGFLSRHRAN